MNLELIVVKYLLVNENYKNYYRYLEIDSYKTNNKQVYKILLVLKKLHEDFQKEAFSPAELLAAIFAAYPALRPDEAEFFSVFVDKLETLDISGEIAENLFTSIKQKSVAHEIAAKAIDTVEGRFKFESFADLVEKQLETARTAKTALDESICLDVGLDTLLSASGASRGLKWRLNTLNKIFGSLNRGDFGFIFARPEVGKTTFLASECSNFLEQTDGNLLFVNNEQRGNVVILRIYSALFGVPEYEIRKDPELYNRLFREKVGDRLKFIDDPGIRKERLEDICAKFEPRVLVFDQLDKVVGFDAERHDLLMKAKYQWARELAKKYGVAIGVCQAGGTAENKRYLDMNDVDSSHTAKQGEADFIIGIGKTSEPGFENMRYLSVCKNKLPHQEGMEEALRHAKTEVLINESIARYEDRLQW